MDIESVPETPYGSAATAVLDRAGEGTAWYAATDPNRYKSPDLMLSDKMPTLVKGAGYARPGGNMPLSDDSDIFRRSMRAETAFRSAIRKGIEKPQEVVKGLSDQFSGQFGAFLTASPQNQAMQAWSANLASALSSIPGVNKDVLKSITTTSPLSSGFVPFDLN